MPMVGSALATQIKSAIAALPDPKSHDDVWNAIGDAIVAFITANALVTVTGTAAGVTAGPSAAEVTGTGTIS